MEDRLLSSADVCEWLCIGRNSLLALLKAKAFPNATRPGRAWRIPEGDVVAFLASRGVQDRSRLIKPAEAAKLVKVHPNTIAGARRRGLVPGIQFGIDWRYPLDAVLQYRERRRAQMAAEREAVKARRQRKREARKLAAQAPKRRKAIPVTEMSEGMYLDWEERKAFNWMRSCERDLDKLQGMASENALQGKLDAEVARAKASLEVARADHAEASRSLLEYRQSARNEHFPVIDG